VDVVAHCLGFALHLYEPVLNHVADRDDTDELIVLDHRDVAKFTG
jgi:hypothetical protein